MATSGSYTYSISRDALIQAAFRLIGQFNDDSPPPATDVTNAAQALNLMIKQWMSKGYPLWCVTDVSIPNVQGQTSYLLGPGASTAFATFRPLRIPAARLQYTGSSPAIEVPLIQISRQEYDQMSQKTAQGITNSYYYDPQLGQGVLYLYLTPNAQANTVILTCQRPLQDMLVSTNDFDFPIEWLNALKFGLATELITEYFVPEAIASRIERRAEKALEEMLDWDQEDADTFFTPDARMGGYGRR